MSTGQGAGLTRFLLTFIYTLRACIGPSYSKISDALASLVRDTIFAIGPGEFLCACVSAVRDFSFFQIYVLIHFLLVSFSSFLSFFFSRPLDMFRDSLEDNRDRPQD